MPNGKRNRAAFRKCQAFSMTEPQRLIPLPRPTSIQALLPYRLYYQGYHFVATDSLHLAPLHSPIENPRTSPSQAKDTSACFPQHPKPARRHSQHRTRIGTKPTNTPTDTNTNINTNTGRPEDRRNGKEAGQGEAIISMRNKHPSFTTSSTHST